MANRPSAALLAASFLLLPCLAVPARADNPMGYRLLSAEEAAQLPHNRGSLGLDVERAQRITDAGLTFDLMRVKEVRRDSPAAQAGLGVGDSIIAVDGRVFPTIATFAAYVGSTAPGSRISIDYIPAGGGPQQAERVAVVVGGPGQAPAKAGMSTGTKIAIGVGAAAVLGCYELGCFSHRSGTGATPGDGVQVRP